MTKLIAAFRNFANAPKDARVEAVTAVSLRIQVLRDFAPSSRVLLIAPFLKCKIRRIETSTLVYPINTN
jgi:hypothetical protein